MPAPETKYTDRDVRENDDLEERAYEYLDNYTGEFQFLVDAKMRLEMEEELPTPIIRGVLNCMRIDVRVTDLPAPLPYQPAKVVPMSRTKQRNKRKVCTNTEPHPQHGGYSSGDEYDYCDGVYLINRERSIAHRVTIKPEYKFALANTGAMIHGVAGAHSMWYPYPHSWGWNRQPALIVRLQCRFPGVLTFPRLLTGKEALDWALRLGLPYCRHCFPEGFHS